MTTGMQIQIVVIDNGYIVQSPPQLTREKLVSLQQAQQQPQPVTHFCKNLEEIKDYFDLILGY